MTLAALLLGPMMLAGAVPTAVEAERAFAAMAQSRGQWTAFRDFAAPDAIMFAPAATNAQALLKPLSDPPIAVMWWPARSWTACDGRLSVNTGPWIRRGGKSTGTFTTVWRRGEDGWKWLLDHGHETPRAVGASDRPAVARASCRNLGAASAARLDPDRLSRDFLYQGDNAMPAGRRPDFHATEAGRLGGGQSVDRSLIWQADGLKGEEGAHRLRVWLWDGSGYRLALEETSGRTDD